MHALRFLVVIVSLFACVRAPSKAILPPGDVVVVAVGDISDPEVKAQAVTATLVESLQPAAVLVLGDAQYGEGTPEQFAHAYAPTWGRFKGITRPVPGNHEYKTSAVGYFAYFGERAGVPGKGYYSFDLGDWHFVALNTSDQCQSVPCDDDSEQLKWLEADLTATTKKCVIAYWHYPRFNSGKHGGFPPAGAFWRVLAKHRAELVLNGHEHLYERMAPMDETGAVVEDGIVQLTVGTGGIGFADFEQPLPASLVRQNDTFGVMRFVLSANHWEADFIGVPGSHFTDHAAGSCR